MASYLIGLVIILLGISDKLYTDQVAVLVHFTLLARRFLLLSRRAKMRVAVIIGPALVMYIIMRNIDISESLRPLNQSLMDSLCSSLPEQAPRFKEKFHPRYITKEPPHPPDMRWWIVKLFFARKDTPQTVKVLEVSGDGYGVSVPVILTCSERLTEMFDLDNFNCLRLSAHLRLLRTIYPFLTHRLLEDIILSGYLSSSLGSIFDSLVDASWASVQSIWSCSCSTFLDSLEMICLTTINCLEMICLKILSCLEIVCSTFFNCLETTAQQSVAFLALSLRRSYQLARRPSTAWRVSLRQPSTAWRQSSRQPLAFFGAVSRFSVQLLANWDPGFWPK